MNVTSRPSRFNATNSCSLSMMLQRRSDSPCTMRSGVWIDDTCVTGERSTYRPTSSHGGTPPCSLIVQCQPISLVPTWVATLLIPALEHAALKQSVRLTTQIDIYPT